MNYQAKQKKTKSQSKFFDIQENSYGENRDQSSFFLWPLKIKFNKDYPNNKLMILRSNKLTWYQSRTHN